MKAEAEPLATTRPSEARNVRPKENSARNLEAQTIISTDVAPHEDEQDIEKGKGAVLKVETLSQRFFFASLFVIKGFSDLFFWNCVISILFVLREEIYTNYPTVTDTLNAVYNVASVVAVIYTIRTGAMNQNVILASGVLLGLCSLLMAITVQFSSGLTGVILLHVWNVVAGASSGFFQGGGLGLASVMPKPVVHFISIGQGTCGVITFLLWMLVSKTGLRVKAALWVLMASGFVVCSLGTGVYYYLTRMPFVRTRISQVQKSLREEATNPNAPSYCFLFKQIWILIISIWFTMFSTLLVFPNIGPMQWRDGEKTDYVIGAFQFGDCFGRMLVTISTVFVLGVRTSFIFAMIRGIVIVALSVTIWRVDHNAFFRSISLHIILMIFTAMSEGFLISVVFINFPKVVIQKDWNSRASSMTLLAILFGILCGLWLARLLTGVVPPVQ